jgi:hypothetical protein
LVSDDTPLGVVGIGEVSFGAIVDDVPPVYAGAGASAGAVAVAGIGAAGAAPGTGAAAGSVAAGAAAAGRVYITVGAVELSGRLENDRGVLSTTSGGGTAGPGAVDSPSGCAFSEGDIGGGGGAHAPSARVRAKQARSGDMASEGANAMPPLCGNLAATGGAGARTRGRA